MIDVKTCFKCGESKPYSEYYKHPAMGDGHLGKCKTCTKKDVAEREERKKSDPDWVVLEAKRARERMRNVRSLGLEKKPSAESRKATLKNWDNRHPQKAIAHNAVNNAIRDGNMVKKPCERCGSTDSEAHHEDYSKPLDVMWFCPKHHAERHVELRDIQRRERALARQLATA